MKLYTRKQFMALPAGTIYCKGAKWYFDGPTIKGDNCGDIDWFYADLNNIEFNDTGERIERLERMEDGASFPSTPLKEEMVYSTMMRCS